MVLRTKTDVKGESWTVEDLYNFTMIGIEPDLVFGRIESLDEVYADESADNRAVRTQRYVRSFEECFNVMHQYMREWSADSEALKKSLLAHLRIQEKDERDTGLQAIQRSFDNA